MTIAGRLYVGDVVHKRLRPRTHALRYRVYSLLLDVDRIDELAARRVVDVGTYRLHKRV